MVSFSDIQLNPSAEQKQQFRIWATTKYGTYEEYLAPAEQNVVGIYIRTHIFTIEMKSVWRETEPYVGVNYYTDIHVNRLQLYRKTLVAKIKCLIANLGKLSFPIEAATMRAVTENRRLQRLSVFMKTPIAKIVVDVEANRTMMKDDCVICMDEHLMVDTCVLTNCGHRFGAKCFAKWGRSCPLCRTVCTEVTEYIVKR